MATDYGIHIRADISEITGDRLARVASKILGALESWTTVVTHNASYAAGSGSPADQITIDISAGGAVTVDWGIRINIDSTVSDNDKVRIRRIVDGALLSETIDAIAHAASYTAGSGQTNQYEIAVT